MILPAQITFRNMEPSEAVASRIREEADKLDTFYRRITSCRVVVQAPHHHHKRGMLYHLTIELGVPGEQLVVKHEPDLHGSLGRAGEEKQRKHSEADAPHKDIYVVIRDTFKAARRQLQDYARRQRGKVKSHLPLPHARVSKLFPNDGANGSHLWPIG